MDWANINVLTALGFSVVLLVAGGLGFVIPAEKSLTSGAPAYNTFHLAFGVLGVVLGVLGPLPSIAFNIGFGAIDLYQFVAGLAGWFPSKHFRYKRADDILHVLLGGGLVVVGVLGVLV